MRMFIDKKTDLIVKLEISKSVLHAMMKPFPNSSTKVVGEIKPMKIGGSRL